MPGPPARGRQGYPAGMAAPRLLRSLGRALCLCAILLIPAGCATTGGTGSGGGSTTVNPGQRSSTGWPFWPQHMRIHPLSQFVKDRQTGNPLLEARIEFSDAYGHTCKAYGEIVIALHNADPADFDEPEIATWPEDLTNLELNDVFFDDVTGTYLFRLEIEDRTVPAEAELRVIFHSADGTMMQDTYVVHK